MVKMTKQFASKLIENPNEGVIKQLFDGVSGVFWVDWREADDDIIRLASKTLPGTELAPVWDGQKLNISFRGERTKVPLRFKPGEQDITLRALSRAISPDFEIRFVKASGGGDTIAFMTLDKESWSELESDFGKKGVDQAFARIKRNSSFFGEESDSSPPVVLEDTESTVNPAFRTVIYRVTRESILEALRSNSKLTIASMPAVKPLFGDLVVTYHHGADKDSPYVTEGAMQEHGVTLKELDQIATDNAHRGPLKVNHHKDGYVHKITGEGVESRIARDFIGGTCLSCFKYSALIVAAFPRRDLVLFAPAVDSEAVAALREAVDRIDFSEVATLSRQLYVWQEERWVLLESLEFDPREDVSAIYSLAHNYQVGNERNRHLPPPDCASAVRLYQQAANLANSKEDMFENGSAARCNLADKYEHGLGVPQDYEKALYWYMKSAEQENHVAQYSLGNMYKDGRGVPQDFAQARAWFTKAAAHGHDQSEWALEQLSKVDV